MVDRVHDYAAVVGTTAQPAAAACLARALEGVLAVAYDTYGSFAGGEDFAGFSAGELDDCVVTLARYELGESACRTGDEGSLAGTHLDVVDECTYGDFAQGKGVADFGSGFGAADNGCAYFETVGGYDVCFCAVDVVEEGDAGRAVGIVLDALYYGGDAVFVSLKVYETEFALVAASKVTGGKVALGVTAARGAFSDCKRLLRW